MKKGATTTVCPQMTTSVGAAWYCVDGHPRHGDGVPFPETCQWWHRCQKPKMAKARLLKGGVVSAPHKAAWLALKTAVEKQRGLESEEGRVALDTLKVTIGKIEREEDIKC